MRLLGERAWSAWRWQGWLDSQSIPFPGEPDLDRVLRFQPAGTFLRAHVDPGITIGVEVTAAVGRCGACGRTITMVEARVFDHA